MGIHPLSPTPRLLQEVYYDRSNFYIYDFDESRMEIFENLYHDMCRSVDELIKQAAPYVPEIGMTECGQQLSIGFEEKLFLKDERMIALFLDYCLFHYQPNGKPLITEIIDTLDKRIGTHGQQVADDLKNAKFAVLRIEEFLLGRAVIVYDCVRGQKRLFFDNQVDLDLELGSIVVCHTIDLEDFIMSTGPSPIFPPTTIEAKLILNAISSLPSKKGEGFGNSETNSCAKVYEICMKYFNGFSQYLD